MNIPEKQILTAKKILTAIYNHGRKNGLSNLKAVSEFDNEVFVYNEPASVACKQTVISMLIKDRLHIENSFITSLNRKQVLSFLQANKHYYYYTESVKKQTKITFLTFEEYSALKECERRIFDLSLIKKITNKEIIQHFDLKDIAYLQKYLVNFESVKIELFIEPFIE